MTRMSCEWRAGPGRTARMARAKRHFSDPVRALLPRTSMHMHKASPGWRGVARALIAASTYTAGVRAGEEPRNDVEMSLLGGYGFGGTFEDEDTNRYQAAIGARGGATLKAPRLYLGGSFVHFFGGEGGGGRVLTNTADVEVGYDFEPGNDLVLRPQLGLGLAQPIMIQSDNAGYPLAFHLAPGALAEMRFRPLLLSAGIRADLVPGGANAFTALGGVGIVF